MPAASKPPVPPDTLAPVRARSGVALRARSGRGLRGETAVPATPETASFALIAGALAVGESLLSPLTGSPDLRRLAAALRALGVSVEELPDVGWRLYGRGIGGLLEPAEALDAGAATPLLLGLLATHPLTATLTGDPAVPLHPVLEPLSRFGARWMARSDGRLPLTLGGAAKPVGQTYTLPADQPPAQAAEITGAVLLAGLNTPGETTVISAAPPNPAESFPAGGILAAYGVDVRLETAAEGTRSLTVTGQPELTGKRLTLPGDPCLAGLLAVAGLIVLDSDITLRGVSLMPLRVGLLPLLQAMGGAIECHDERLAAETLVADLVVRAAPLTGITVTAAQTKALGEDLPALVLAAACAAGETQIAGVTDADALIAAFTAAGVSLRQEDGGLTVSGGITLSAPVMVSCPLDPPLALALLILGLAAPQAIKIADTGPLLSAFPSCVDLITRLGGDLEDVT